MVNVARVVKNCTIITYHFKLISLYFYLKIESWNAPGTHVTKIFGSACEAVKC